MRKSRTRLGALVAAGALSLGCASTASAQTQEGLVNVNISDVVVQVPVGIAANVCDLDVNALAQQVDLGPTTCTAVSDPDANAPGGGQGGPPPRQNGLVNVNLDDIIVQVPVAVAANICDVSVNVLARAVEGGAVNCDAFADPNAEV